jgi:hypothetical protein
MRFWAPNRTNHLGIRQRNESLCGLHAFVRQAPHVQRTRPNALNRHRLQRALAWHRRSQRNSAVSDRDDLDQVLHGTQIVRVARIER